MRDIRQDLQIYESAPQMNEQVIAKEGNQPKKLLLSRPAMHKSEFTHTNLKALQHLHNVLVPLFLIPCSRNCLQQRNFPSGGSATPSDSC